LRASVVLVIIAQFSGGMRSVDNSTKFEIQFPETPPVDAGRLAQDLVDLIQGEAGVEAHTARSSKDAMDLGTTVVLVLGTPAVLALAKGIADWIRKKGDPQLVIKKGDQEITVNSGLSPEQKFELIKAALGNGK
jgi:hypothetical protein